MPTGCLPLDDMLGGGIENGVITQVFGEAGSGKTNLCIQTAVSCIKCGFSDALEKYKEIFEKAQAMEDVDSIAYLCDIILSVSPDIPEGTENKRSQKKEAVPFHKEKLFKQIRQMFLQTFVPKVVIIDTEGLSAERFKQIAGEEAEKIAKNIIIYEPHDFDEQYSAIREIEKIIKQNVGLVIVDSATSYYRYELDDETAGIQGRRELANQIGYLHTLSRKYEFPVLITSQVFSDVNGTKTLRPIGGKAIEHISKTILFFEKIGTGERSATLLKHRSLPEGRTCRFRITGKGLE